MRVLFLNPQGNFDKNLSYLGKHPDFGGQLVYVMELAKAMVRQGIKADILTRQIIDDNWIGFDKEIETLMDGQLRIIRIPFGGSKFLRKEDLWPHINEFVIGINNFYNNSNESFDFLTAHYADGGISAALLSKLTGIPYSFTAHSLGAQKLKTLNVNANNLNSMDVKYNLTTRIIAERISMQNSLYNITSTYQERFEQYTHKLYRDISDVHNKNKFHVIPPGVNIDKFNLNPTKNEAIILNKIKKYIDRDIKKSRKNLPYIIAASRLDEKKNHMGLINAYISNKELQKKSNLMIQMQGIENAFKDYSFVNGESKTVIQNILASIRENNLKGKICLVNLETQDYLPVCYRFLANSRSIFCLPAYHEPFGIAPLEAMSCGLPVVVTNVGGPTEVLEENTKKYGLLVNPTDPIDISNKILELISSDIVWSFYRKQGLKRVNERYTWDMAAKKQISIIEGKLKDKNIIEQKLKSIPTYFYSGDKKYKLSVENLEALYLYDSNQLKFSQ
ncbi:MAG: glycosyltransferase [Clostridiales bacterium]